jgi:hypothetical protein
VNAWKAYGWFLAGAFSVLGLGFLYQRHLLAASGDDELGATG